MSPKNIAIAGLLHESNTFLPVPTTYDNFLQASLVKGPELIHRWKSGHHELSGMLQQVEHLGLQIVPLMATFAMPSGTIQKDAFEQLLEEMLGSLNRAGELDGLLLALHGATVSEANPDADGEILRRFRAALPDRVPIVATFDLHANISQTMVDHSTALIGYRTNPHLDQKERGAEAASVLARILHDDVHPAQALEKPPLAIANSRQYTSEFPAKALYDDLDEVLAWPGILTASVAMGFCHADVEEMGTSFMAVADDDPDLAKRAAKWMAERAWRNRREFTSRLPSPEEAVRHAASARKTPVVLMDVGDNVGGGSPGDSTVLFEEVLRQGVPNGLVVLYDPVAVSTCMSAGVRESVELDVGAKTDDRHGRPVRIRGRVRTLSDGLFEETLVRHGAWGCNDQGVTAVVETEQRHTVVLTSRRMAPMSLQQILSLGIQPESKQVLIVKGVVAPRAAYEPIGGEILLVDTPGCTEDNPVELNYQRRRRPLFPFETDVTYV